MKSITLLMLSCLALILFTGMINRDHTNAVSSWVKLSGSDGQDICVNEKGEFFLVNTTGKLYKYEGPKWTEMTAFKGVKIYIENKGVQARFGNDFFIKYECRRNSAGIVTGMSITNDTYWKHVPDLAVGSDSTIWYMNWKDDEILASKCGNITRVPGIFSRIAAGGGQVWMINKQGLIYRLKDPKHVNMGWEQMPGANGRDITVSNDGYVFVVNTQGRIFQWTGFKWDQLDGSDGFRIAANNRKIVLINTDREIYTRNY